MVFFRIDFCSTCHGVLTGNSSGLLNIVDLSGLALERSKTAKEAILTMGKLATDYGYNDNGESLLVIDKLEAFIFHILPDSTKQHAIWVAQRVPSNHIAVVANAFTIRTIDFHSPNDFFYSSNIKSEAVQLGWNPSMEFDFTRIFSGNEMGHKYASGRRMWIIYSLLGDAPNISPTYTEFVSSKPYLATVPIRKSKKISLFDMMQMMRNYYEDTPFDMTKGFYAMSGGPFGSPSRWETPTDLKGNWERTITTWKSILSYVITARSWLPNEVGGMLWYAPHASITSCYVPFSVGMNSSFLYPSFTNNSFDRVDRGISSWHASRFVFNLAQIKFSSMLVDIQSLQNKLEYNSLLLSKEVEKRYLQNKNISEVGQSYRNNGIDVIKQWWDLSDVLYRKYADGFCNGCPIRSPGYPDWWLKESGYQQGPPDSPPVPPMK